MKCLTDYSESLEDYLEAILRLGGENVRSVDIANQLGVSRASVNRAINTLISDQLVNKLPYGAVSLTDRGREVSARVEGKHLILCRFLTEVLGVEETQADIEACGIEHNISDDTAKRIEKLVFQSKKKS